MNLIYYLRSKLEILQIFFEGWKREALPPPAHPGRLRLSGTLTVGLQSQTRRIDPRLRWATSMPPGATHLTPSCSRLVCRRCAEGCERSVSPDASWHLRRHVLPPAHGKLADWQTRRVKVHPPLRLLTLYFDIKEQSLVCVLSPLFS